LWLWSAGREKKATSFGIMPTGRPSWQSRRAGEPGAGGLPAGGPVGELANIRISGGPERQLPYEKIYNICMD